MAGCSVPFSRESSAVLTTRREVHAGGRDLGRKSRPPVHTNPGSCVLAAPREVSTVPPSYARST